MIINLLRQLLSPYSAMQKVDFRPLEFIEVEFGKPLIIKLNEKWFFKSNLMRADNFIRFNTSKNMIFDSLDKLNKSNDGSKTVSLAKIACYRNIIRLLFEISKEGMGLFKRRRYYKFLNRLFLDDLILLQEVLSKVLRFNTEVKKK